MYVYVYVYMWRARACACLSLCFLCGAVSRRVSRVAARYVLFVVRDLSLVFDCLSLCCALLSLFLRDVVVAVAGCCGGGGHVRVVPAYTGTF